VPKQEQVGILWSDLAPFVKSKKRRSGLADVINVPSDTFSLENLIGILSCEVCLAFLLPTILFTLIYFMVIPFVLYMAALDLLESYYFVGVSLLYRAISLAVHQQRLSLSVGMVYMSDRS
jgi:hypothetical protein